MQLYKKNDWEAKNEFIKYSKWITIIFKCNLFLQDHVIELMTMIDGLSIHFDIVSMFYWNNLFDPYPF